MSKLQERITQFLALKLNGLEKGHRTTGRNGKCLNNTTRTARARYMNISHPGVPALTITSKKAAAKPRRDAKAPRSNSRAIVTFTGQQGFAMRAVRAIPTGCHCGVRAAPGDGICSAATCSGLYLFWLAETVLRRTRANAEIEAGWGGAGAAKKAEVLAPATATATRDEFIGHHITLVGPYSKETKKLENSSGRIR